MKTCATCHHFHKPPAMSASIRTEDFMTGTCHATPPTSDFKWNRTRSHDYCAHHSDNVAPQFATGTTGPAPLAVTKTAAAPSTDLTPRVVSPSKSRGKPARGELFPHETTR